MSPPPFEFQPCGHAEPTELPPDTVTVTTDQLRVIVEEGDHHGHTLISLFVNLPTPVGAACIRLNGAQLHHLRTTINALGNQIPEQIAALDDQLNAAAIQERLRSSPAALARRRTRTRLRNHHDDAEDSR